MTQVTASLTTEARRDIQGFIASGYGHLNVAAYLLIRVADAAAGRRWIGELVPTIATAAEWPRDARGRAVKPSVAINLALTADGLHACGLPSSVLCTFPPEFREGMASAARSRILGDTEESGPAAWEFGGPGGESIHALVIIHAHDEDALKQACVDERLRIQRTNGGVVERSGPEQRGYRPQTDTEPFGFKDGIAQPAIVGLAGHGVPTGEFILGYPNHYDVIPTSAAVPSGLDPHGMLPRLDNPYHDRDAWRDLGRHGSFVVYRKLQQHVGVFWRAMREESVRQRGSADPAYMIWLASKMVGRWPSGAPLLEAPDRDDPERAAHDAFGYSGDPDGLACPVGAHVRRALPRDDLKPYPPEQARHMSEAHRILRRARVFGPPLVDPAALLPGRSTDRQVITTLEDDGVARGIHFFCVNASIRSQFEFVQQTWCNNPSFGGLSGNKDPIVGDHSRPDEPPTRMVIRTRDETIRTNPLPRFVTVRGGAYLFMPSLTALRFLAAGPFA
jgi:Dyp-type peroxidase family